MKIQMTRLEMLWLFCVVAGCISLPVDRSPAVVIAFTSFFIISLFVLTMFRWNQMKKEKQKLEAKFAAQDAELLNQFNQQHD